MHTDAHSLGSQLEEPQLHVWLPSYSIIGVTDTGWDTVRLERGMDKSSSGKRGRGDEEATWPPHEGAGWMSHLCQGMEDG